LAVSGSTLLLLRRRGLIGDHGELTEDQDAAQQDLLPLLQAASIQGRVAQGEEAGSAVERIGRMTTKVAPFIPKRLCASIDGFTLHAAVRVEEGRRDRLERLCRYINRPPFSNERLSRSRSGKVVLELRHAWRDGTTHISFSPLTFIERLAALVPPPGFHQLTYHGVLAGGSALRDDIVPETRGKRCGSGNDINRYRYAELMQRVFGVDVLRCPNCRGRRELIALIFDPEVIERILKCLGVPHEPPAIAAARPPPQLEFEY